MTREEYTAALCRVGISEAAAEDLADDYDCKNNCFFEKLGKVPFAGNIDTDFSCRNNGRI